MTKTDSRKATIANLTFLLGAIEELKSNLNDTLRYVKQNPDSWQNEEEAASNEEQQEEEPETEQ